MQFRSVAPHVLLPIRLLVYLLLLPTLPANYQSPALTPPPSHLQLRIRRVGKS